MCDHYERDLRDAEHLAQQRPGSVLVVKYEELVTQPRAVIPIILKVAAIFFRASRKYCTHAKNICVSILYVLPYLELFRRVKYLYLNKKYFLFHNNRCFALVPGSQLAPRPGQVHL